MIKYHIPISVVNLESAIQKYFSNYPHTSKGILNKIVSQLKGLGNIDMNDIDLFCKDALLNIEHIFGRNDYKPSSSVYVLDLVLKAYLPFYRSYNAVSSKHTTIVEQLNKLKFKSLQSYS